MKKHIHINFVGFSRDFDKETNDFIKLLRKHYDVEISENPEYLFYSAFGKEHTKYDCIKIFYTGECIVPNFNLCDYAIGFENLSYGDRYIRVPLYQLFQYKSALQAAIQRTNMVEPKTKFCSFVCSNDQGMPERKRMFDLLSQYKKVDSGGRYLNNVGGQVKDKQAFDREHKFSIAFENCIADGYTTEKIIEAFAAGTIPIYLGNPGIEQEINPKAFINCMAFKTLEEAVAKVQEIDSDDTLYRSMLAEPVFSNGTPTLASLEQFLCHIIDQPIEQARRRPKNTRIEEEEKNARLIYHYEKRIGKYLKKFRSLIRRIKRGAL